MVVYFGLDTFSYGLLGRLADESWKSILTELIEQTNFFITHEVRKEIEFHHSNHLDWLEKMTLRPLINKNFKKYVQLGFDSADASLLEIADDEHSVVIITEDKDMLDQGVTKRKNIIKIADFFSLIYNNEFFTKNEFLILMDRLYQMRQVSKIMKERLLRGINKS